MKNRMLKRLLGVLLSLILVIGMLPTTAIAAVIVQNSSDPVVAMFFDMYGEMVSELSIGKKTTLTSDKLNGSTITLSKTDGKYLLNFSKGSATVGGCSGYIGGNIIVTTKDNSIIDMEMHFEENSRVDSFKTDLLRRVGAIHASCANLTITGKPVNITSSITTNRDALDMTSDKDVTLAGVFGRSVNIENTVAIALSSSQCTRVDDELIKSYGVYAFDGIKIASNGRVRCSTSWDSVQKMDINSRFYGLYTFGGTIEVNGGMVLNSISNKSDWTYGNDTSLYCDIYNYADEQSTIANNGKISITGGAHVELDVADITKHLPISGIVTNGCTANTASITINDSTVIYGDHVAQGIVDNSATTANVAGVEILQDSDVKINTNGTMSDFSRTVGIMTKNRGVKIDSSNVTVVSGLPIGSAPYGLMGFNTSTYGLQVKDSDLTLTAKVGSKAFEINKSSETISNFNLTNGGVVTMTAANNDAAIGGLFTFSGNTKVTKGNYYENMTGYGKLDDKGTYTMVLESSTIGALTGSVGYVGTTFHAGETINVNATTNADSSKLNYYWQVRSTARPYYWISIRGARGASFTPTNDLAGRMIRVAVSADDYTGVIYGSSIIVQEANVLLGDVNGDGKINVADAMVFQRKLANWDVEFVEAAADMNDDGKINSADHIFLQRKLAGWDAYQ